MSYHLVTNIGYGYVINAYLPDLQTNLAWLSSRLSQYYCCHDLCNGMVYLGRIGITTIRIPVVLQRRPGRPWPVLGGLAFTDTGQMSCCALIKDALAVDEATERAALDTELDSLTLAGFDPVLLNQIKQGGQYGRWLYSYYETVTG